MNLGLSGRLTAAFIRSPLTPLILLAALAVGLLAVMSIPREEEPQISVPMIDIVAAAPGLSATDAVELVGKPLEAIVKSIPDVEHVYTFADDDQVMVVVRFKVGTHPDNAVVRVSERINANIDRIPTGIPPPLVQVKGINDVPMLTLTLSPDPGEANRWDGATLRLIADQLQTEVTKVQDVGQTFVVGGQPEQITRPGATGAEGCHPWGADGHAASGQSRLSRRRRPGRWNRPFCHRRPDPDQYNRHRSPDRAFG
jgi:multidrug efflux pump subunit AcrB